MCLLFIIYEGVDDERRLEALRIMLESNLLNKEFFTVAHQRSIWPLGGKHNSDNPQEST